MNKWDQCLYNKVHFWHSNAVVSLTGHVVSEPDCMVKVPEVRWEFHRGGHRFWGFMSRLQVDNFQRGSGMAGHQPSQRQCGGEETNLAGTWLKPCCNNLSKISCPGVPVCYFSLRKTMALQEMDKAWRFDEVCMLPFSWASKVRLVWWLTKISEIARMRHRLPDLKVRASFSHRGHTTTSSSKRCSHWAMCSFPLTNRNRTYHMKLSHEPSLWLGRTWMKSPVTSPRCILFLCWSELKYSSHWNYEVHQLQMDLKPSWSCSGDKYHL